MWLNRISESNVMTICITRQLPLFDFNCPDISLASIIHPSQKLWPLEFSKSFLVQFRGSQYITRLKLTSEWKFMTILIVRELPLFNFKRLDISWASIIYPSQKLTSFEFSETFLVQFWLSRYIMSLNRTSERKVMTIWITRELPLFNFERLDITCASIIHPTQKLKPLEFAKSFRVHFWLSQYIYAPELDIRVKSYDHFNYSRASVVQFWVSWYIMGLNHTPESTVKAIWIYRELSCSILIVSIYCAPESNIQAKSSNHLNYSRASVV